MALQACQTGTTTGFPIVLSQNLYKDWPATKDSQGQLKSIVAPTDFTIQWGPPAAVANISVLQNTDVFQISGFNTISDATTLTYGLARYKCSEILSVVQNQHTSLIPLTDTVQYEAILAFYIENKSTNPSSPDVILMCRPLVFGNTQTTPFWAAVNSAVKAGKSQPLANFDMSTLYGYNKDVLIPMITYQTCLPIKLINYVTSGSQTGHRTRVNQNVTGNINVRVHVSTQPIFIIADPGGTQLCSTVSKYKLALQPARPANLFNTLGTSSASTVFQFKDGLGNGGFPSGTLENLVPLKSNSAISSFNQGNNSVLNTFVYLVPKEFLGKSLAEIAEANSHTPKPNKKKSFKCYKLDPETDIKGDQILIDPTTGQSPNDTMKQKAYDDSGGSPADFNLALSGPDTSGVMPGDVQHIVFIVLTAFGTIFLLAYLIYIVHTLVYRKNGFHESIYHIVIFVALLIGLVLFGVYFGEPAPPPDTTK